MNFKYWGKLCAAFAMMSPIIAQAQDKIPITLQGSLQADVLFPEEDDAIQSGIYKDKVLANAYLSLNLQSTYVKIGRAHV